MVVAVGVPAPELVVAVDGLPEEELLGREEREAGVERKLCDGER